MSGSGQRVAVVGAGLAGLAAALECADRGARVTLVERRRRLGGLTWSFEHNGAAIDNGQHVFLACCHAYLGFLERIGASGDVTPPRPLDIPVVAPGRRPGDGPRLGRLRRRPLPVPLHLAGSLLRYRHLGAVGRLRLGPALLALMRLDLDDPGLDRRTFGEWLAAHGQSPEAVAAVWDLITVPTVNLPASEASLATAAMVFRTGLLSRPGAADIGWSRVPLGRLHGERAAVALSGAGVEVHTGTRVTAVLPAEGAPGHRVVVEDGVIDCDAVIVALPHEEAAQVVPGSAVPGRSRWPDLGASAVVDVHLFFDRQVTRWPLMAGHGSAVQWVFDRTESSGLAPSDGGAGPQYLAVSFSAADHLLGDRPEALIESTVRELGRLLPAVSAARLTDALVTKERNATFRAGPGTAAIRPQAATALPGLALAGAWTATGWPATMEGAVRSGWAAAAAITRPATTHPDGARPAVTPAGGAGPAGPTPMHPANVSQEVA